MAHRKHFRNLTAEWSFSKTLRTIGFRLEADEDITLGIHLLFAHLWLSLDLPWSVMRRWNGRDREWGAEATFGREMGGRLGTYRWFWNNPTMEWSSRDPWWQRGSFEPYERAMRLIFGLDRTHEEIITTRPTSVPMPEGNYPATLTVKRLTWRRPRAWWTSRTRVDTWVDLTIGIPFPGKGENSWDCGMDALFGTGANGDDESAAVANCVKSALENRRKYGGPGWKLPEVPAGVTR